MGCQIQNLQPLLAIYLSSFHGVEIWQLNLKSVIKVLLDAYSHAN